MVKVIQKKKKKFSLHAIITNPFFPLIVLAILGIGTYTLLKTRHLFDYRAPAQSSMPYTMTLGTEEAGFPNIPNELLGSWPDTTLSMIKDTNGTKLWLTSEVRSYRYSRQDLNNLTPQGRTSNGNPIPVFLPSNPGGTEFDADYVGFGSVLPSQNPGELIGIYHAEHHCPGKPNNPYTATVGVATSTDGGISWTRKGAIITGRTHNTSCDKPRVSGAGQPSAIKIGDYLYVYYTDWSTGYPDQIYLARAPFNVATTPGNYKKWHNGDFSTPGLGGESTPIISRPEPVSESVFVSLANISFNTYLNRYLLLFQASNGFYTALSTDGIFFDTPQMVPITFPKNLGNLATGDIWYYYATLISPNTPGGWETNQTGYLYYSKGQHNTSYHTMYRRPFTFNLLLPTSTATPTPTAAIQNPTPTSTQILLNTPTPTATPRPTATPKIPTATAIPTLLPTATPITADTQAPKIAILNPANNSFISKNTTTIQTSATDNKKVSVVEFYIDGKLNRIDTQQPFTYSWNTKNVSKGGHKIKVVAYDQNNNSATNEITVNKSKNAPFYYFWR